MNSGIVVSGVILYAFYCSACLVLASDHRPDHTLCIACDGLELEVLRRRLVAAEKRVRELEVMLGSAVTSDLVPEELCASET